MKKKKVYIVMGYYDYEGGTFIGVYSTRKKAENNKRGGFDSYDILQFHINGKEIKQRVKKNSGDLMKQIKLNAPFLEITSQMLNQFKCGN